MSITLSASGQIKTMMESRDAGHYGEWMRYAAKERGERIRRTDEQIE